MRWGEERVGNNLIQACDRARSSTLVPAFIARGLSKVYEMGDVAVHALRSVDLELRDGELVVILGASGSGKSTLLNILGGLDVPSGGEVFYRDHNLTIEDLPELSMPWCKRR